MSFRARRTGHLVVTFLFLLSAAAPALARQHTWKGVERIVAVGDLHGDADAFVEVLRAAKVIDKKNDWIAGKTHLVQVGDVLDRAPDSRRAMDLLMKLEEQAAKAGGCVHALIGNHEAMVLFGDWRYVHPGEIKAFGGEKEFEKAMSADGKYGKWIRSHNAILKINDSLFLHAGLEKPFAEKDRGKLNEAIRNQLRKGDREGPVTHPSGPLWYRGNALRRGEDLDTDLDAITKAHGVKRIIIGHTVSLEGIQVRGEGRVIMIDTGLSQYYRRHGGRPGCLIIEKGELYGLYPGKKPKKLEIPEPAGALP
jgi:hypothetical protein